MSGVISEPSALRNPNSTRPPGNRRERIFPIGSGHTRTSPLNCQVPVGASAGRKRSDGRIRRPLANSTACSTRPSSPTRAMIRSRCGSGADAAAVSGASSSRSSRLLSIERRSRNRELAPSASEAAQSAASIARPVNGANEAHLRVELQQFVDVRCSGCLEGAA